MIYLKNDMNAELIHTISNRNILPNNIYRIEGLTSFKTQNILAELARNKDVLEIGSLYGATTLALSYYAKEVTTIDNWSDIEILPIKNNIKIKKTVINKTYDIFKNNIKSIDNIKLIVGDIFSKKIWSKLRLRKFELIFYDGPHNVKDIIQFINLYSFLFKKDTILIFDDYNFDAVQKGIKYGFETINIEIEKSIKIETEGESKYEIWNGIAVFQF